MMTNLFSIFDPSTNSYLNNWLSMFIILLLLPTMIFTTTHPKSYTIKNLINFMLNSFKPNIQNKSYSLMMIWTIFIFTMINNIMGLMPYIFTASTHMSFTMSLALPLWLGMFLYNWIYKTKTQLIHLVPQGTPPVLMPVMVLIETISMIIRPLTLSVRLAANMIAGHLLLTLLSSSNINSPLLALFPIFSSQFMLSTLEIAVALIQSYVFTILMTLYMAE